MAIADAAYPRQRNDKDMPIYAIAGCRKEVACSFLFLDGECMDMPRFLYKYMPLREEFFSNTMIRATPAHGLNDPFEMQFNRAQVRDAVQALAEYFNAGGNSWGEIDDEYVQGEMEALEGEFDNLGVISFTEDFDNPLMWAHYADEHRGMVVEFDTSKPLFAGSCVQIEAGARMSRFGDRFTSSAFEFPEKVRYRREMPVFDRSEYAVPDSFNEFHWRKFSRAILFTKAIDWMYEKEWRSVVELCEADSIASDDCSHIRGVCDGLDDVELTEPDVGRINVCFPIGFEMQDDVGDFGVRKEVHHLSANSNGPVIHLFRVDPAAISAIYFGRRADERECLKVLKGNRHLDHVERIFKMRVSNSEYRLTPELHSKFSR